MAPKATFKKMRLDLLLVQRGLADSRSKAQALIMSGNVHGPDRRLDKANSTGLTQIEEQEKNVGRFLLVRVEGGNVLTRLTLGAAANRLV